MTISSSLANALSGLTVSGRRAEVVSNNIANAQTEGYGRRELATSSGWGGVQSHGVVRNIDRGIINDRRLAESQLGADQRRADMLLRLETLIGIPGDGDTITGRLADLESALVSASSDPASDQRLAAVNTAMKTVVDTFHRTSDGVQILRQDADAAIATDVEMLNSSLRQLEQINADISRASASGMDPSSLLDARHHIVDTIGAIVPVRELDRGRGQLGLMTVSGMILIDGNASQFGFSSTATIVPEMTLASGGLSGLTFNGQPVDADDGFGRLAGGSLAAAFTQRDNTFVDVQNELDKIAYDMVARFSDSSVDPTIMSLGLLTDNGGVAG
jgi:flagellar hook-associated protein 1 FlgK